MTANDATGQARDLPADEAAIRALAAAYTDAVNRRAAADMAAVYAPDGVLQVGGGPQIAGIEKIGRAFARLVEQQREFLFQMTHSGVIDIQGDRAGARWWFSEIKKPTGGDYLYVLGVYQDDVVRLPQGWRFARRVADQLFECRLPGDGIVQQGLPPFLGLRTLPGP
ncbi:MAG: nuclear transport factor 2 family protein [Gammaproteobacteria bacterium]